MSPARRTPSAPGIALLLIALTLCTYWPTIHCGFVNWDDMEHVARNPDITSPTLKAAKRYWTTPYFGLWIPVTNTLWQATAALSSSDSGAPNPAPFHALNLALHAATTVLVFLIVRRLIPRDWPAAFGAAVFAVHPIQVEAVAWVSGLRDVLGGALSLFSILIYLRSVDSTGRPRIGYYAAATTLFALALLSKPTSAVTPLILLAILWRLQIRTASIFRWLSTWFVMSAIVLTIAWFVQPTGDLSPAPLWSRPLVAFDAIGFYLRKIFAPSEFLIDYGRSPDWLLAHPSAWWLAAVALLITILIAVFRHRIPLIATAAAIGVAALVPVLGLVPFSFQYFSTVADRYAYLAMLGIAIACAIGASALPLRRIWLSLIAITVALALSANRQAQIWQDTASLCNHTLSFNPNSLAALRILTFESLADGNPTTALQFNARAMRARPHDPLLLFDRANALRDAGRPIEAEADYAESLSKRPDDPQLRNNYAVLLAQQGQNAQAEQQFTQVLKQAPHYAQARANWATYLALHGHRDRALAEFRLALADDPRCADARRGVESLEHH